MLFGSLARSCKGAPFSREQARQAKPWFRNRGNGMCKGQAFSIARQMGYVLPIGLDRSGRRGCAAALRSFRIL